jgi:hypothetical protein
VERWVLFLCLADIAMVAAAAVYGRKFLKKRNYLLGLEWLVMMTSGSNFLLFFLTGSPFVYNVSFFFDAFSRAFGFPVIAVAGVMAITHNYKPSTFADIAFFVLSSVGAGVLVAVPLVFAFKPYFYLAMSALLSIYLLYFSWRLLRARERLHAALMFLVMLTVQLIALMDDFYRIPGDDPNLPARFYVLALLTWAYMLVEMYYGYCALERARA